MAPHPDGGLAQLTPRELEILRYVSAGERSARIAAQLGITEATVKSHLNHVYRKLSVTSRVQAVTHYLTHSASSAAERTPPDLGPPTHKP